MYVIYASSQNVRDLHNFPADSLQVLFPNHEAALLLARMIEIFGPMDSEMLDLGQETRMYFTDDRAIYRKDEVLMAFPLFTPHFPCADWRFEALTQVDPHDHELVLRVPQNRNLFRLAGDGSSGAHNPREVNTVQPPRKLRPAVHRVPRLPASDEPSEETHRRAGAAASLVLPSVPMKAGVPSSPEVSKAENFLGSVNFIISFLIKNSIFLSINGSLALLV